VVGTAATGVLVYLLLSASTHESKSLAAQMASQGAVRHGHWLTMHADEFLVAVRHARHTLPCMQAPYWAV
jgi:hypothetical protein